jgi:hypothetical protein
LPIPKPPTIIAIADKAVIEKAALAFLAAKKLPIKYYSFHFLSNIVIPPQNT